MSAESASAKPRKQEQEPASEEVTEVAPGILRMQLPIAFGGLGHVNTYVLEDGKGVALVDPGMPGPKSWANLKKRLKDAGIPMKRVHSVIVTHSHPDHFGAADRLRHEFNVDIISNENFSLWWDPTEPPDLDIEDLGYLPATKLKRPPLANPPWGGPGLEIPLRRRLSMPFTHRIPRMLGTPKPNVRLADAQRITLARREWIALHTPGHTADHLCLFDPECGVMLCGDHVLPTITPHISGLLRVSDPLAKFFDSLDKVARFGDQVKIALPAHGHPFQGLRNRTEEIKEHHRERLQKLRSASEELGRPATVMEMSTFLFSPRVQGAMADNETFAHLEHLRITGEYRRVDTDGTFLYEPI